MSSVNAGILFPQALLESRFFVVLATIVALNTIVYAGLAVSKVLPQLIRRARFHRAKRRAINRTIYPVAGEAFGADVPAVSRKSTG